VVLCLAVLAVVVAVKLPRALLPMLVGLEEKMAMPLVVVRLVEVVRSELLVLFFVVGLAEVAVAAVQTQAQLLVKLAVLGRLTAVVVVVGQQGKQSHQVLVVLVDRVVLKFTHGDKYVQICNYK
jgi:hypothetical protein